MCALMAVMAVVAAAMSIWISALGCKVACCGASTTGVCLNSSLCFRMACHSLWTNYTCASVQQRQYTIPNSRCGCGSAFSALQCIATLQYLILEWQDMDIEALRFLVQPYRTRCHWQSVIQRYHCLNSMHTWRPFFCADLIKCQHSTFTAV